MNKKIFLIFVIIALLSLTSFSAIIYVSKNATGLNNGSSWQNAYTDLKTAFENISENDVIYISADTYNICGVYSKRNVQIIGGFVSDNNTPTSVTIIESDNSSSLPAIYLDDDNKVKNIIFQNCWCALDASDDYNVEISNCEFKNNLIGIFLNYSKVYIHNCKFYSNQEKAIYGQNDFSEIYDNEIYDNQDYGIYLQENSETKIYNNQFHDNGISLALHSSKAEVYANTFQNDSNAGINVLFQDKSHIYGNSISLCNIGIKMTQDNSLIYSNNIFQNTTAIYGENYSTGTFGENNVLSQNDLAIYTTNANIKVEKNIFKDNNNVFKFDNSDNVVCRNIVKNTTSLVADIKNNQNSFFNNVFADNNFLFKIDFAATNVFNNTFYSFNKGIDIYNAYISIPVSIFNNIFWNDTDKATFNIQKDASSSSVFISNNCYNFKVPAFDSNPVLETISPFKNPVTEDFSLKDSSLCIDAGLDNLRYTKTILIDFIGNKRYSLTKISSLPNIADLSAVASVIDIGAYEYQSGYTELDDLYSHNPINLSFDTPASVIGLHHVKISQIIDGITEFVTYFPDEDRYFDPYFYLNFSGHLINSNDYQYLLIRIYSPVAREKVMQFYFIDEMGNAYSTPFIDLEKGWNVKFINLPALSSDWNGKKIKLFRFDFNFTDKIQHDNNTQPGDFEYDFKIDWVKFFPVVKFYTASPDWNLFF